MVPAGACPPTTMIFFQEAELVFDGFELAVEICIYNQGLGTAVIEKIEVVLGLHQGVETDRNRP